MISPCPECGGQRVSAPLYGDASVGRGRWPVRHVTTLTALACLSCGHTTLYVRDLEKLRKAVRKHPKQFEFGAPTETIPQSRPPMDAELDTAEQPTVFTQPRHR